MNPNPTLEEVRPSPARSLPWLQIAWFGGLLILCYLPVLIRLVKNWMDDDNASHGFFVPLVAGYIAWQRRDEILSREYSGHWLGLLLIGWGAMQVVIAKLGAEIFLAARRFSSRWPAFCWPSAASRCFVCSRSRSFCCCS